MWLVVGGILGFRLASDYYVAVWQNFRRFIGVEVRHLLGKLLHQRGHVLREPLKKIAEVLGKWSKLIKTECPVSFLSSSCQRHQGDGAGKQVFHQTNMDIGQRDFNF